MRIVLSCFIVLWVLAGSASPEGVAPVPLIRAHAHNDYLHKRPLLDALDNGFCSVEADIHLVDGKLLVAHDLDKTQPDRTLERLYLDPLRERVKANGGHVYPNGPQFTLLIDIKGDGEKAYAVLHETLAEYPDVFTVFRGDAVEQGPVIALISGSCPRETIVAQPVRYAAIDGRPPDFDSDISINLVPLISSSWSDLFEWKGKGPLPPGDAAKLRELVRKAHEKGRRIRFWGLPWRPTVWPLLYDAGVDLINADNLKGLRGFLLERMKHEQETK